MMQIPLSRRSQLPSPSINSPWELYSTPGHVLAACDSCASARPMPLSHPWRGGRCPGPGKIVSFPELKGNWKQAKHWIMHTAWTMKCRCAGGHGGHGHWGRSHLGHDGLMVLRTKVLPRELEFLPCKVNCMEWITALLDGEKQCVHAMQAECIQILCGSRIATNRPTTNILQSPAKVARNHSAQGYPNQLQESYKLWSNWWKQSFTFFHIISYYIHIQSYRSEIDGEFGMHAMPHARVSVCSRGSWHAAARHGARPRPPQCGLSPDQNLTSSFTSFWSKLILRFSMTPFDSFIGISYFCSRIGSIRHLGSCRGNAS